MDVSEAETVALQIQTDVNQESEVSSSFSTARSLFLLGGHVFRVPDVAASLSLSLYYVWIETIATQARGEGKNYVATRLYLLHIKEGIHTYVRVPRVGYHVSEAIWLSTYRSSSPFPSS